MFWFFGLKACGILDSWPGIKPAHPVLEAEVLTTGPPGKSLSNYFNVQINFPPNFETFHVPYLQCYFTDIFSINSWSIWRVSPLCHILYYVEKWMRYFLSFKMCIVALSCSLKATLCFLVQSLLSWECKLNRECRLWKIQILLQPTANWVTMSKLTQPCQHFGKQFDSTVFWVITSELVNSFLIINF